MVLVIDDHAATRRVLRTVLETEGCEVVEARDGDEGLRLARRLGPNVVITDIAMPRLGGVATAERLRADPRTKTTPVIAVTGEIQNLAGRAASLRTLFDEVILKPIEPRELRAAVTSLCERV